MTLLLKDPEAILDYEIDWGVDYLNDAEMLESSDWTVTPVEAGGVEIVGQDFGPTVALVKASGGLAGRLYRLQNRIVTAAGRTDTRSITLRVEAR